MPLSGRLARGALVGAQLAAFSVAPAHAAEAAEAPDPRIACAEHAERGQRAKLDGRLRSAREAFLACAQDACPPAVHRPCAEWLFEIERSLPSIVVVVHAADGSAGAPARAWIDDEEIDVSSGRAAALDPGPHVIRARAASGGEASTRVVAVEGRKAEVVHVHVTVAGSDSVGERRAGPTFTTGRYIAAGIGGAGVVGLATTALLALSARGRYDDASPFCDGDACDPTGLAIRGEAIERADLATGVGVISVIGIAAAAVLWIVTPAAGSR